MRQLEHVSQAAPPTAQGGADSSGPRTADVHEAPRGDNAQPHQDAAQTPSGGGAPQGPPPQNGESGAGASGATGSHSRGEKGGAEAGGVSGGTGGGAGIGRGSGGGIGSRGGASAPQDSGEGNKKRKFVSGEGAFAQHATSASAPSSSQEVHMSDGTRAGLLPQKGGATVGAWGWRGWLVLRKAALQLYLLASTSIAVKCAGLA